VERDRKTWKENGINNLKYNVHSKTPIASGHGHATLINVVLPYDYYKPPPRG
jgi:hypothetical protein